MERYYENPRLILIIVIVLILGKIFLKNLVEKIINSTNTGKKFFKKFNGKNY